MRTRFARLDLRHQLRVLFMLFLLAGVGVLTVDEIAQYRARQSLLELRDESLRNLRRLKKVSDAYGLDVVDTAFRARHSLITWKQGEANLQAAQARLKESWPILEQLPRTTEEQAEFEAAKRERADADAALRELRDILRRRDLAALTAFSDTRLYPAVDPLTQRMKRLSDLAMVSADAVVEQNLRANRRVSALRISLTLLALTVIASVGRRILRDAYRGIETLTFLADRMREHDYTVRPSYFPAHGELRRVTETFLDMRKDVHKYELELKQQIQRNERTRQELARRELFQRSLLEAAQVAIAAMDGKGRWTVFNPYAERLLGWSAHELLGRIPRRGGPPQPDDAPSVMADEDFERLVASLARQLGREVPADWRILYELAELGRPPMEAQLVHKDGHKVPVQMALAALHDAQGRRTGLIVGASDLTERKSLEVELRESEARSREASRAKSAFLAAMSHEIRTPMTGVTGMVEVLAHSRLDADQRHALEVIQQSSQWLLQIIGDILDFSKIEAGRLELSPSVIDLGAVLCGTVASYAAAAASKGLTLTCDVDPRVAPAYRADPLRLRQILGNFVSNAIKFTAAGSVEAALEWRGSVPPDATHALGADELSFRISDTGIGISAEQQQRLFQPFAQAEQDISRRYGGTGLGLAISQRLAELMGAQLTMDSVPGVGTTMRLGMLVPRAPKDELPPGGPVTCLEETGYLPRRLPSVEQAERDRSLVLLVDDHPTNRHVIARQLALAGYASEAARDGAEGLERWRTGRYALLLTDLHMPRMDGLEMTARIREEEHARGLARTPIVALTASALKGEAEHCLEAGMDDYLAKPVPLMLLAATLQRWLPNTVPPQDLGAALSADASAALAAAGVPPPEASGPLDLIVLSELCGDAQAGEVLRDFMQATAEDLSMLASRRDEGDLAGLIRQAHKVKGAASLAGASELAQAAAALEEAGRGGDQDAIAARIDEAHAAVERLRLYVAERYPHRERRT